MAAQQGNGDTASSIVVAQGRQVHLRNTPMTKFALIAAAAVALLARDDSTDSVTVRSAAPAAVSSLKNSGAG